MLAVFYNPRENCATVHKFLVDKSHMFFYRNIEFLLGNLRYIKKKKKKENSVSDMIAFNYKIVTL